MFACCAADQNVLQVIQTLGTLVNIKKYGWGLRAVIYKIIGLKVGWLTYIGPPLIIEGVKKMRIGRKVRIYPGARIECHHGGEIVIENDVSIGQNFHVTSCEGSLKIGQGTVISGNVVVTNIDHEYTEVQESISMQPLNFRPTCISKNCFIGYGAVLQAGTVLGEHCVVGANSVVRGEFPAFTVIAGAPAKAIKQYDSEARDWLRVKGNK